MAEAASSNEPKVALVTGGSSGIGEATAKLLLEKGYKVAICGSRKEKVDRVLAECAQLSPCKFQPLGLVLDFNEAENGKIAVEKTVAHFGRLDVLINNAGIFRKTSSADADAYSRYKQVMTVNLDATVSASLAAVEPLKATRGQVIFISSTAAVKAHENGFAYCASKAAMSSFARCYAIDLAQQVRVNIVSPGPVVTDIFQGVGVSPEIARVAMANTTLDGRVGEAHEVAETVLFLLSPSANYISGNELFIDGGYLLKPSTNTANQQLRPHIKKD